MNNSTNVEFRHGEVYEVKVTDLKPNPRQSRKYFDAEEMKGLEESIRETGIINPITFTGKEDELIIIAGERRWQAASNVGFESIQAKYVEKDLLLISFAENFHRADLNAIEKAEALLELQTQLDCTLEQLAQRISKSKTTVSELLSLNRLPADVKDICRQSNKYVLTRLVEIAKAGDEEAMRSMFLKYQKELQCQTGKRKSVNSQSEINRIISWISGSITQIKKLDINAQDKESVMRLCNKAEEFHQISSMMAGKYQNSNDVRETEHQD